jgi:hypothetical protein
MIIDNSSGEKKEGRGAALEHQMTHIILILSENNPSVI